MGKYIVKRVLLAIVSILIVSAITFFVMNIIPGGPFNKEKATSAEAQKVLEERYNLDKPIPEQYVIYMNNLDRKSTRLNSSHYQQSRMPSSA